MNEFKNRKLSMVVLHISLIMSILSGSTIAQIVTNGGFENSSTGIVENTDVEGWVIEVASITPPPVFEIVSDIVQEGSRALKVSIEEIGSNQWDIQVVSDSLPVIPGNTYNYSIWAKAERTGAQVNFTVGNYAYQEYGAIRPATLTTDWQEFKLQFTVNDDQTYIRAPVHLNYIADTSNVIYIDNLNIMDDNFGKTPIIVEAESGAAGSKFSVLTDEDITYVTTNENYTGATNPGDTGRMITYQVTFPDSGYYNLFARLRVNSGGFDDDSYFAGKGFGEKSPVTDDDWVMINGLASAGFYNPTDVVDAMGTSGSGMWKWVNITKNFFQNASAEDTFYVSLDSLTKNFQIASREDGLDIDKLAFGKAYLYYSVEDLDNELPGSTTIEKPEFYPGPPFAQGKSKFLGNAYGDIPDEVFANYWTQLTPGNAGKWGSVGYTQDTTQWGWTGLDRAYNYAKDNGLIFKDHTLVWGQQQPSWISALDPAEQLIYIKAWFRMVGERYPDIDMVDVVNEALTGHNPPDGGNGRADYIDALGGKGDTGYDWVITSFELARQYLPGVDLLLNDYGIINDNNATNSYLQIINLLMDRGLIDGIGVQGHRFELENASTTTLTANLDKLAATGLPVYISEFDLGNLSNSGTPDDDQQLQLYQRIFPVLWEHPGVKGITLWGYLEGQMWQTSCYLVLTNGQSRPALDWLANYVETTILSSETDGQMYEIPSGINLEQNYPNPFSSTTTIEFGISEPSHVSLKIYNILGKEVKTLLDKDLIEGIYRIDWDAINTDGAESLSGTYYIRLVAGGQVITKKMLLLK